MTEVESMAHPGAGKHGVPAVAKDAAPPYEGVYLFDRTGRRVAATPGNELLTPFVQTLGDLEARFVQPDGVPLSLARRGRRAAALAGVPNGRALLVSEPLVGNPPDGFDGVAISIMPFGADDATAIQRALASVLAHELRTPLTTIQAGAELVAAEGVSAATKMAAAQSVARETERLHQVIEDLVVLVRWGVDPPPEDEPVLIHRLLATAVDRRSRHGLTAPIDLRLEDDLPAVAGDPLQLEHAFRNLLDHAIANSPPGQAIVVQARRQGGAVEVQFQDLGPGRDAAAAAAAFELFVRSTRSARDPSGGNFAMVVARRLVERMRGRIHASEAPHGSTIVTLPLAG